MTRKLFLVKYQEKNYYKFFCETSHYNKTSVENISLFFITKH